jgi:hypothetical protein
MAQNIVFLKTEWMEFYDGRKGDKAPGRFAYVKKNDEAHEDFNFKQRGDYFYAYAPIAGGGGGVGIQRLGASKDASHVDGVDVVFIAAGPDGRGVVVVGWYRGARVYRALQTRNGRHFVARCAAGSAKRLDVDDRWFRIENPPRRANVWYAEDRPKFIAEVRRLLDGRLAKAGQARTTIRDVERCLRVEMSAYAAVIRKYEESGFEVTQVWKDKVGWDLEASRGSVRLRIEVKGTEGSEIRAELTPNEYTASGTHDNFRICIVTAALSKKPTVHSFKENFEGSWFDEGGLIRLLFEPKTGARLSV